MKDFQYTIELIFQSFIFGIFIVGVRRPIDDLEPENQPGSGFIRTGSGSGSRALELKYDVCHQKYGNKRKVLQNYLVFYFFHGIQNTPHRSGYRALEPN